MKTRKMNERISQLIDQELGADQQNSVIDEMIRHEPASKSWQRYQLIGDVVRGNIDRTGPDLTQRVRACLQAEPTVVAPRQLNKGKRMAGAGAETHIWKPVGLFALAASLVAVAVITLGPLDDSLRQNTIVTVDRPGSEPSVMSVPEFSEMLAGHGEFTSSPAFNGLLAHMVLVSNQALVR